MRCLRSHQARRWQLTLEGEHGERQATLEQRSPQRSPAYPLDGEGIGERGEPGERFSDLRARARVHNNKEEQTRSQGSSRSQNGAGSDAYTGERGGEPQNACSPRSLMTESPDWLKGVP